MKLSSKIFFCYLIIFSICFSSPLNWIINTLRLRYLEGVEDPLADQAHILAGFAEAEMASGGFDAEIWYEIFEKTYARPVSAQIYKLLKEQVDVRVYITDASGRILFDSETRDNIGKDYSRWRDVRLTLKGQYGARSTQKNPEDRTSTVLYVAAPIRVDGDIVGVLTVCKPTSNIKYFLKNAKPEIIRMGLLYLLGAGILSFLVSLWLTFPIKRLTRYAREIRDGKDPEMPALDRSEIGEMGEAFEQMKEALEGKRYVERYVQNLTHEIKSPLSAIRGAAELMSEDMDKDRRERFLANIRNEALRIQQIVDRMLELAALENRKRLEETGIISVPTLMKTVLESKEPMLSQKQIRVEGDMPEMMEIRGDSFLLHQAVSNLIQNAIDFSPEKGSIALCVKAEREKICFRISDEGPGIPDYAIPKVFDKFFSLQRPDTGKKSTGLGLSFVRQVALLHGGEVQLENREGKGCAAVLRVKSRVWDS